mmetsp:Transcript_6699/g.19131  ORF Transcript_6699/g.19131 Transcript_6699/m.19131 type:complete len:134 (+) Transcript_6699:186-587(+)
MCVSVGCQDLKDAFIDCQNSHIKGSTTEIKDENVLFVFLFHPVGHGRRRRFIDDSFYMQAGNSSCIFGGMALSIVKVSRHRNDCSLYGLSQKCFGRLFHFLKYHGRYFFGSKGLSRRNFDKRSSFHVYNLIGK